jgi:hypothetical protein
MDEVSGTSSSSCSQPQMAQPLGVVVIVSCIAFSSAALPAHEGRGRVRRGAAGQGGRTKRPGARERPVSDFPLAVGRWASFRWPRSEFRVPSCPRDSAPSSMSPSGLARASDVGCRAWRPADHRPPWGAAGSAPSDPVRCAHAVPRRGRHGFADIGDTSAIPRRGRHDVVDAGHITVCGQRAIGFASDGGTPPPRADPRWR